jgi:transposase InsO family protein
MIQAAEELGEDVGVAEACRVLGVPRSSVYRARQPQAEPCPRPTPERALSAEEKAEVRAILNSERFCDAAPREVYATLLDEGVYYCHWRTMYRILEEHHEVRERRPQEHHAPSDKPELRAQAPNQIWSWDITQLQGPGNQFYYLYTIIDIFSRYVTGWMLARKESGALADKLISETCAKQEIARDQLILHADRGSAMRSQTVAELLRELGVTKSHARPATPTDNPYSEAQFKTLKYQLDYPGRFAGFDDARAWVRTFFAWYNEEHHHSGLGLLTPETVHYGQAERVLEQRQEVLADAYAAHPERFVGGRPTPPQVPEEVWINQPQVDQEETTFSAGPAASESVPGAQAGSRAESAASLDADEHLASLKRTLVPADDDNMDVSSLN